MPGPDQDRARQAQEALARIAEDWIARAGVVAVEVARRREDGIPTDEIAIRVTVDAPPESGAFPETLDGIPVDIVEGRAPGPET